MRPQLVKTFFAGLIVALILSLPINAQSPDQLMQEGNKFYQENQFDKAAESYGRILRQGYQSPVLYYNLGNSYFRTGKLGLAILNYEKGLRLDPGDEDLQYNLKIANSRTVDKIAELPKLFFVEWWDSLVTSMNVSGWSVTVVIFYLLLLASIGTYFISGNIRLQRLSFLSGSVSLVILILAATLFFARLNRDASTDYGILIENTASAKIAPDSKSNDAFIIHEGIKFSVEDKVGDWTKIRLTDGKVGWLQNNSFGKI